MKLLTKKVLFVGLIFFSAGCQQQEADPNPVLTDEVSAANGKACWGQASAVFARMRQMRIHSSSQANSRLGLRNLARALYDAGVIPDDSMDALGKFVADELGLSIDACN